MKINIDKEVKRTLGIRDGVSFEESKASCIDDGKDKVCPATEIYDIVKKEKLKKYKLYLTNINLANTYKNVDIVDLIHHIIRVDQVSLEHPVVMSMEGNILDGVHRIIKAILIGKKRVRAYRLTSQPNWTTE